MLPIPLNQAIANINARIDAACTQAKRAPSNVKLLLATKTQSYEQINAAINLGYGLIGENRAQELVQKAPQLITSPTQHTPRENHFIGPLQSNKINQLLPFVACFQSIDRLSIATRLNNACLRANTQKTIFVQVNTSCEAQKHGVDPKELLHFLDSLTPLSALTVQGFMTVGLNSQDEVSVRKGFATLKALNVQAIAQGLIPPLAHELSMGMSHDLEWAIAEGATIIRVGSAIFGARA